MADAELKVIITGDASDLERTIKQVEGKLNTLGKTSSSAAAKDTSATTANTKAKKQNTQEEKQNAQAKKQSTNAKKQNTQAENENAQASNRGKKTIDQNTESVNKNTRATEENSKKQKISAKAYQQAGTSIKDAGESINTLTKPLQVASVAMAAGGVAAAKFAIDFEDNFAAVKKTVDGTTEELETVKRDIIDMSTVGINGHSAIPLTTEQLTELAAAGGQLGIKTENIASFTETMAMLGTATNLVGEQGAATLARFMNVTNTSQEQIANLGSAIVDLGNHYATTEAEIADMAMNMGATASTVGMSAQDILAFSTVLSSMGVEAAAGGSAVSRILMSIQEAVTQGGAGLAQFAKISGKSSKDFSKAWGDNATSAFKDFLDGMSKLSGEKQLKLLGDLGFNNIRDIQALQRLAGEKGIDLLTDALERSNTAWKDSSALLTEFNGKAETTASKIQIAKNNLVEAGRSIGESLLPMVSNGAVKLADFAKGIADMSDEQKQGLITTGKWVIGLGAGTKVTVGALKGVGNAVEAVGKLKAATATGGVLAKFAPALTSVGAAAPYAVAGIAAVGAAVYGGKKAYDAWYDSQYRWAKNIEKGNVELRESVTQYKGISNALNALKAAKIVIENPDSSVEEVKSAKENVQKIADLLAKEYNLKINVDDPNLDNAVEQVENATKRSKVDVELDFNSQKRYIAGLREEAEAYEEARKGAEENAQAANDKYVNLDTLYTKGVELDSALKSGKITLKDYNTAWKQIGREMEISKLQLAGMSSSDISRELTDDWKKAKNSAEKYNKKLTDIEGNHEDFVNGVKSFADIGIEKAAIEWNDDEFVEAGKSLQEIGSFLRLANLDLNEYAQKTAAAMVGTENFSTAAQAGGKTLDNFISSYIAASVSFGESTEKSIANAALLKNGLTDITQVDEGNLKNVLADIKTLGEQRGIEMSVEKMNEMAHAIGLLENAHIEITADGDYQVVNDLSNRVIELDGKQIQISVDAEDNATVTIDGIVYKVSEYDGTTHTATITAEDGASQTINLITGELSEVKDKDITVETDYAKGEQALPSDETAKVNYELGTQKDPEDKTAYVDYIPRTGSFARGTSDFQGGLARINDERGVADPRELVEVNGSQYLFPGRDVILPLPEHAKVYTASQTKAILAARGIKSYAKGKNNDELDFIEALKFKADMGWISQEEYHSQLAQYRDINFAPNTDGYKDATLELQRYSQQQVKDANAASEGWLELRGVLNDWDDIGDSRNAAYDRIDQRLSVAAQNGLITWDEYYAHMNDTSEQIIGDYIDYSDEWIAHEKEYNAMSADDTIAAIDRQQQTVDAFFKGLGELTDEQYAVKLKIDTTLAESRMDEVARGVDEWRADADWYKQQAEVYGWGFQGDGDTEAAYWQRRLDKEIEASQNMELSENERNEAMRNADLARMELYKLEERALDDMFAEAQNAIDEMSEQFRKEEEALQKSWEVEDRAEEKEDIQRQLDIYKGAVTKEGKDKYKELQQQLEQIEREEQLFNLQEKNNATIERMEEELKFAEENKKVLLEDVRKNGTTISQYCEVLDSNATNGIPNILGSILEKLDQLGITDNRQYSQNNYNYVNDRTEAEIYGNASGRFFNTSSYGG